MAGRARTQPTRIDNALVGAGGGRRARWQTSRRPGRRVQRLPRPGLALAGSGPRRDGEGDAASARPRLQLIQPHRRPASVRPTRAQSGPGQQRAQLPDRKGIPADSLWLPRRRPPPPAWAATARRGRAPQPPHRASAVDPLGRRASSSHGLSLSPGGLAVGQGTAGTGAPGDPAVKTPAAPPGRGEPFLGIINAGLRLGVDNRPVTTPQKEQPRNAERLPLVDIHHRPAPRRYPERCACRQPPPPVAWREAAGAAHCHRGGRPQHALTPHGRRQYLRVRRRSSDVKPNGPGRPSASRPPTNAAGPLQPDYSQVASPMPACG